MIKPYSKNEDGLKKDSFQKGITYILTKDNGRKHSFRLLDGLLSNVYTSFEGELPQGSIVVGKVSEINESIHCAFILILAKTKCFISISELCPEYNLSRPEKPVKCGDLIIVKIKKNASKGKKATVTTDIFGNRDDNLKLVEASRSKVAYSIIKEELPLYIQPACNEDKPATIVTEDEELYNSALNYLDSSKYDIVLYKDKLISLNALLSVNSKLEEATSKKVWLKSGAFLYIENTEAMTVIDVNSGKNSKKNDELYFEINKEALVESIRQISLRNLSGIIIIDFINMSSYEQRNELLKYAQDYAPKYDKLINIIDITKLGLMEITRQKNGYTIFEQF